MRRIFSLLILLVIFLLSLTACEALVFPRSLPDQEYLENQPVQPTNTVTSAAGSSIYPTLTPTLQDKDETPMLFQPISCEKDFCQFDWPGWLARPFSEPDRYQIDLTYSYASRGDGDLAIHHGVEFPNPYGTPVRAGANGEVVYTGNDEELVFGPYPNFYGNVVILKHDEMFGGTDVFSLYGHLSKINIEVDDIVQAGDVLGEVGASGVAGGSHLHFEVRYDDNNYQKSTNPVLWFSPMTNQALGGASTLAGRISDSSGNFISEASFTLERFSDQGVVERHYYLKSYAQNGVNSHPILKENFAVPDLLPGEYRLTYISGRMYEIYFTLEQGMLGFIDLQID